MLLVSRIRSLALGCAGATLLLGSFEMAPSAYAQVDAVACNGAASWLQLSEDRFRVFQPLLSELLASLGLTAEELVPEPQDDFDQQQLDSLIENFPQWSEAAEQAVQEQVGSAPPSAARELNNQIVVALGSYAVAFEDMTSLLSGVIDEEAASDAVIILEDIERETEHVRRLAQSLKAECVLTSSGEFFNPGCYGEDALAWYERTNARTFDMGEALDTPQAHAAISDLRTGQESDAPPAGLEGMQTAYLSFYEEILSYFVGSSDEATAQANLTRIGATLESEKARLDIACATE